MPTSITGSETRKKEINNNVKHGMVHLDKETKIGTLFFTESKRLAIYLGKVKQNGKFSFRFRLLGEHIAIQQYVDIFKPKPHLFSVNDTIYHGSTVLKVMNIEYAFGDWYVRANGLTTDSNVVFPHAIMNILPPDNQIYIQENPLSI